ncbi:hypothetical protein GCM10008015_24240 [Flavobacterium palustre]|uniref:YARHG domain-containing protein n=1 Tax=Flavobacterium palustre TaxID=1476463 RepID=A0ABQ1HM29_9FLAO|nr:hypothetical protein [Flavobacterium palustre]GGA82652.1 hypothetical protein GCM10008015_24240 [Flavobacterium palustre]
MKNLFTLYFVFLSLFIYAQKEVTPAIKIYLEDAETGKNISDAKVTLEGYEIPAITGKYDKKNRCFYFSNINYSQYDLIYIDSKKKEPQVFKKAKYFPSELNFKLYKKGTIVKIDTYYNKSPVMNSTREGDFVKEDSTTSYINKEISTLDHHKVLIKLENSSSLTYLEIKAKIDSLVEPYGLEYIDDLVPEIYFIQFYGLEFHGTFAGENSIICSIDEKKSVKDFFKENPDRINFIENHPMGEDEYTATDFFSENKEFYNNVYDWKKNCYVLPYRKKNKTSFRLENDQIINRIKKHTNQLEFGKIIYDKFQITTYPSQDNYEENKDITQQLDSKILDELDSQIMNYRFLKEYDNDFTRLMLMDFDIRDLYLNKDGLNAPRDFDIQMVHWSQAKWKHSFLLDEKSPYSKQSANINNKTQCNLQRNIGYRFLFE